MPAVSFGRLKQFAAVGASLVTLATLAGPAGAATRLTWPLADPSAQPSQTQMAARPVAAAQGVSARADAMSLGEAAPAPLGYLRFCARRPDQCGLEGEPWSNLNAMTVEDRADQLLAKYYWSIAFARGPSASLNLSPAAGGVSPPAVAGSSPDGRYDWSSIFGPAAAAPTKGNLVVAPQAPADDAVMSQASPANTAGDSSIEMGRLSLAGQGDPFDPVNSVLAWRQVAPSAADPFPPPSSVQALDDVAASPNRYAPAAEVAVWLASLPAGPDIVTARLGLTGRDASSGAVAGPSGAGLVTWTGDAGTVELVPAILTTVAADAGQAQVGPQQAATAPARAADAAAPLAMDSATSALLDQVNLRVNQAIRFVADSVQYGVEDYWTLPLDAGGSGEGECKDYVLEKRRALIEAGAPAADLSIAIVRTTWGETHAVLLVATDRGEIVLDSLSSRIVPWRKAPYRWVERQAPGQQLVWVKVVSGSD